jgi:transposase
MMTKRRRFTAEFKARVALEAIRGEQTIGELAAKHGLHPNLITTWRRQAVEGLASVFDGKTAERDQVRDTALKDLHAKIGQLVIERDFLAKASGR